MTSALPLQSQDEWRHLSITAHGDLDLLPVKRSVTRVGAYHTERARVALLASTTEVHSYCPRGCRRLWEAQPSSVFLLVPRTFDPDSRPRTPVSSIPFPLWPLDLYRRWARVPIPGVYHPFILIIILLLTPATRPVLLPPYVPIILIRRPHLLLC